MADSSVEKPWGFYHVLARGDGWLTKLIEVEPNQRLSHQRHSLRSEYWVVVAGMAKMELNGRVMVLQEGDDVSILRGDWHRVQACESGCTIIETQYGVCDENDIVRKEDDYGREDPK